MVDNKPFYSSKKFIAFALSLAVIAGVLVTALVTQTFTLAMSIFMGIGILGICTLAIAYVTTQGTLDKFLNTVGSLTNQKEDKDEKED